MIEYNLHWNNGDIVTVKGDDIADAMNKAGYGAGVLKALDYYVEAERDTFANFKHLRDTKHTHNPVDDAKGNAEAMMKIVEKYEIKAKF